MPTVKEMKEHLATYKDDDVIAWDIWTTEDAIWQAKREGKHLTEEQAQEVIEEVHRHKDAELGINWDTLSCYLPADLPEIAENCPYPDDSDCQGCNKCLEKVGDPEVKA